MTLGYLLRRYRQERGLTQRALGRKAQVRQALISELESGRKKDTMSQTLVRLAEALEISLGQLLGKETPDPYAAPYA